MTTTTRSRPAPGPASVGGPVGPARAAHPRIRARRAAVAADLGRRRRRRLNGVLGVVCAGVWTLVGLRSPVLDVDRVQVVGAVQTDAAAVRAATSIGRGEPLVEADLGAARRGVAALPWVDEVKVQRRWPGTVRVEVTERTALAAVRHPDGWATVDRTGRVLAVGRSRPPLVELAGGVRAGAPGSVLPDGAGVGLDVLARLAGTWPGELVAVDRGDAGLVLRSASGPPVVVGDGSDLAAKVLAARAVLREVPAGAACHVDVRVPSAPVAALTGGPACD